MRSGSLGIPVVNSRTYHGNSREPVYSKQSLQPLLPVKPFGGLAAEGNLRM